jgi:hypothetical protein
MTSRAFIKKLQANTLTPKDIAEYIKRADKHSARYIRMLCEAPLLTLLILEDSTLLNNCFDIKRPDGSTDYREYIIEAIISSNDFVGSALEHVLEGRLRVMYLSGIPLLDVTADYLEEKFGEA